MLDLANHWMLAEVATSLSRQNDVALHVLNGQKGVIVDVYCPSMHRTDTAIDLLPPR